MKKNELDTLIKELNAGKKDMQGLISRGYNSLNSACYILLKIINTTLAKSYFNYLIANHITSAAKPAKQYQTDKGDPKEAVHIAFTHSGLLALDLPVEVRRTFSRQFIEGMAFTYLDDDFSIIKERSNILGDTMNNEPDNWRWGNASNPVDCVIMLYAEDNTKLNNLIHTIYCNNKQGVDLVYMGDTFQYDPNISKEHFGFQDGISQPVIKGLSKSKKHQLDDDKLLNPGEFILGYKNDYNNYSPSPYINVGQKNSDKLPLLPGHSDKKDLGKNGTYLVFRQMKQHVEKFWDFHIKHSKETTLPPIDKAVKLAAKMIGRWPEGEPLVTCPISPYPIKHINTFSYATQDKDGVNCPLGAHIRRTNPRDQVHTGRGAIDSIHLSKKHRMLRRGRIYGEPLVKDFDVEKMIEELNKKKYKTSATTKDRGLHFICLVSDIERQFEFVQSVWANTSTFGDLCNEVDPIISPRPTANQPHCHEFTTPQDKIRNRYKEVPEFTTVVGGAYFFMPGIEALKFIVS